jgi:hypothetical protein
MYNQRKWLNKKSSANSGSVVAYHGPSPHGSSSKKPSTYTFFEVGDCHQTCRLHRGDKDTMADYIAKIRKLQKVASDYADWLEKNA